VLASCGFYMSWNPWLITLILFSASVDYIVALRLVTVRSTALRRSLLILSISTNLGLLAFFKYTNFLLSSTHSLLGWLGFTHDARFLHIVLPLGISFYTFETISYVVDVYHGRFPPVRNLVDYALYIMFFPHLLAGPIVRPADFLPQVGRRKHFSWNRSLLGAQCFLVGLFKKAVLADHLAAVIDPVFAQPSEFASSAVWLAVVGYAVQIYCDFSGYSDMAIGAAHALGFRLPCNFNLPYLAVNISDFWRRWHISLSTWLRDYLYIPLGGSRGGKWATYRNLLVTMLLGGLWHGANWTFVFWGAYHGMLLALHRALGRSEAMGTRPSIFRQPLAIAATFLSVLVGWVFFRAQSFPDAAALLARMAWPTSGQVLDLLSARVALACIAVALAGHLLGAWVNAKKLERWLPVPVLGAGLALSLALMQVLMPVTGKLFIYFRF
jgi:alginate O-acetyltransferase complex protein AlgI